MNTHKSLLKFPVELLESRAATEDFSRHSKDVMNIRFNLVYEGMNGNGDYFTGDEMRNSYGSLVNKPITWEHAEPNIGTITHAELAGGSVSDPLHIICEATIWAYRYPEFADVLTASAKLGELGLGEAAEYAMSMEVYFDDADYVIGNRVIPASKDNGDLEALRGRTIGGKTIYRVLKGLTFGGAGATPNPAEKRARLLAVASNKSVTTGDQLFAELDDSDFAIPSKRMFPKNTATRVNASLEVFDTVAALLTPDEVEYAEIKNAHDELLHAAEEFNLETHGHHCFACELPADASNEEVITHLRRDYMGSSCESETREVKEESKTMGKTNDSDESAVLDEAVETAEATEETTEEAVEEKPAPEEAEAEEETPVEEAPAEEAEAEVEDENTEEEAEEAEAESETPDVAAELTEIKSMLTRLMPTDASASEEGESEASAKIQELTDEVARLTDELNKSQAALVGHMRLAELVGAGIQVDAKAEQEKREFLASLDEKSWGVYLSDIRTVAASKTLEEMETEDTLGESSASLILEDDEMTEYRNEKTFWTSSTVRVPKR